MRLILTIICILHIHLPNPIAATKKETTKNLHDRHYRIQSDEKQKTNDFPPPKRGKRGNDEIYAKKLELLKALREFNERKRRIDEQQKEIEQDELSEFEDEDGNVSENRQEGNDPQTNVLEGKNSKNKGKEIELGPETAHNREHLEASVRTKTPTNKAENVIKTNCKKKKAYLVKIWRRKMCQILSKVTA